MQEPSIEENQIEQRIRDSFARQAAMQLMGAEVSKVGPGEVEIRMPFRNELTQQNGYLHAGILSAVLDSACGYAALTLMQKTADVLTIEFKINLLAPGRGDHFIFRGAVTKPGRTIMVCDGKAYGVTDGQEKCIATMTGTMMVMSEQRSINA